VVDYKTVPLTKERINARYDATVLHLNEGMYSSIDSQTFRGFNNLKQIFLYENWLTSLDAETFNGLTNLELLSLSHNHLESLDYRVFR